MASACGGHRQLLAETSIRYGGPGVSGGHHLLGDPAAAAADRGERRLRGGSRDRLNEEPGVACSPVPGGLWWDDIDEAGGEGEASAGTIVEERGPLRADKVFVTDGERVAISDNLGAAYGALDQAWGVWREKARGRVWDDQYWDQGDVADLESLTLDALNAVERTWRALTRVTDAHEAQLRAAEEAEEDADDLDE